MRVQGMLLAMVLTLAACASPPTAGEDTAAAQSPTDQPAAAGTEDGTGAAGDSSGLDAVLAEVEGLSGDERRAKLVELAQEEGEVSLYTSMNGDIVQEVGDAFDEEFDIDVSIYRASSETVLQRLIEESNAGFPGADLVETNGTEMFALSNEDILVPVESPATENQVEGALFDDWTATRFNIFAVSWNTELADSAPTSWEEFADPKWDGRMSMELGDVDWYMALHDYWTQEAGKTEDEADQLFEDMAKGALIVKGHTLTGQLLAAGEFAAALSNYSYITQATIDDGAPLAWQPPVEPLLPRPNGIGFVKGVPHPAAALLFYEWVLSDGQEVLQEQGIDPSREDLLSTGDAELYFVDLQKFTEQQDELEARYEELMQLGSQVEG
jgi:iron(III) transport system substrate-binding protein